MKKLVCFAFAMILALGCALACAEEGFSFDLLSGKVFEFSSGAGGWFTELTIAADGTFTGDFHDSEMGETGDAYPNGTVYGCSFHGRFSAVEQVNEYTWKLKVDELAMDDGRDTETIEDGVRFAVTEPYGITEGAEMLLYLPGSPVSGLPDGYMVWSHLDEIAEGAAELPFYGLYDEANECGFASYDAAAADASAD